MLVRTDGEEEKRPTFNSLQTGCVNRELHWWMWQGGREGIAQLKIRKTTKPDQDFLQFAVATKRMESSLIVVTNAKNTLTWVLSGEETFIELR